MQEAVKKQQDDIKKLIKDKQEEGKKQIDDIVKTEKAAAKGKEDIAEAMSQTTPWTWPYRSI